MVTLSDADNNFDQDQSDQTKPDTINAIGGDDIILSSTLGGSLIRGGNGNDTLLSRGPAGIGNSGEGDTLEGGNGDDTLDFRAAGGTGFGDEGNDTLKAITQTTLYGGNGEDSLISLIEGNYLSGNRDNDRFFITERDTVYGGKGNDTILNRDTSTPSENSGFNFISANNNEDYVEVSGDRDTIYGGKENDTLISSGSRVFISGDKGNDTITNSEERSTLLGGEGDDSIMGGLDPSPSDENDNSRNSLEGGAGSDTLIGRGARDTLIGGEGNDSIVSKPTDEGSDGQNRLDGGAGSDTLVGGYATDTMIGGDGNDSLSGMFTKGDGGGGNDTINATAAGTDAAQITLIGGAGNDSLLGNTSAGVSNFFDGGTGNDFIQFGSTNDQLIGNNRGNDTIAAVGNSTSGFDIQDTFGNNTITGGAGNDTLVTGGGNDSITGGNSVSEDSPDLGDDRIVAGAGNDTIFGRGGKDTIIGGDGDDYIVGGLDSTGDSLIGGAGNDSFVYFGLDGEDQSPNSVIVDFDTADDKILLRGQGFNLANSKAGSTIANADLVLIDPGNNYSNDDARSTNPTIIYEPEPLNGNERINSGLLKYDPSGSGGDDNSDVVTIARLNGNPGLENSDILII